MLEPHDALDINQARRLAADMSSTLLGWSRRLDQSGEFAQDVEMTRLLIDRSPESRSQNRYKYEWTAAIYVYFKHLARDPSRLGCHKNEWSVCPPEKPYKDEFLTDYAIWEAGYGLRVACESQWHEGAKNENRVASAFDKLLHVKADIKILVFEDSHKSGDLLDRLQTRYMTNYLRFRTSEEYLFLQWDHENLRQYLWRPTEEKPPVLLQS
jgi:hypothetical protein